MSVQPDVPVPDEHPPPRIDTTVPHSARIWNYWLGGKDNYPVDREAGDAYLHISPGIVETARASRYLLARFIRYLTGEAKIRQFLDIGTGLPTVDNTHELAQCAAPDSRIVYVDNDPLVLAHARALLTGTSPGTVDYIDADLRDPDRIIAQAAKTLDFDRPIALMLMGILGHIDGYDLARSLVRRLVDALPAGSYLALYDGVEGNAASHQALDDYSSRGAVPYHLRSREEIVGFFDGLDLVEPGVVPLSEWRPELPNLDPPTVTALGGIGRKVR
ncbi:SAM-dependent methyltransferase [Thermopolyspora sp. NPDC052614]|uniref:SAM-dependent methyltransferase n=1 Tax=Thermopolyspora sp. NPDC052614 TaxID=3155682 RepID=UPI003416E55C